MKIRAHVGAAALLAATAGCLVVGTTTANASTLRSTSDGYRYVAAPGEANTVDAHVELGTLVIADTGAAAFDRALPEGCSAEPAETGVAARCAAKGDQVLRVDLGDGDDWLAASDLPRRVALVVDTGDGENVVEGGAGDDTIHGGDGRDTLYGGPGDDRIVGHGGSNYLRGNGGDDVIRGGDELDFVYGDAGDDLLDGGDYLDFIEGGGGDDTIRGGGGDDFIGGGRGDDAVFGGAGDDELRGGKGSDSLSGGEGDDLLRARDGESDTLACGGGVDVARVDAGEVDMARRSCETVKQADAAVVEPADVA